MARPLQAQLPVPPLVISIPNTTTFLLLASVAAIASVVISLCTTRKEHFKMSKEKKKKINSTPGALSGKDRKLLISSLSNVGRKAMGMAKMISYWKKKASYEVEEEEAVWKKSIVMGEKCRQLDFSGQILYDSEGNQLPELPPRTARGGGAQAAGHMGKV